jgi:hypothetical protein
MHCQICPVPLLPHTKQPVLEKTTGVPAQDTPEATFGGHGGYVPGGQSNWPSQRAHAYSAPGDCAGTLHPYEDPPPVPELVPVPDPDELVSSEPAPPSWKACPPSEWLPPVSPDLPATWPPQDPRTRSARECVCAFMRRILPPSPRNALPSERDPRKARLFAPVQTYVRGQGAPFMLSA